MEGFDWTKIPRYNEITLEEGVAYLYKTDILKRKYLPIALPAAIKWTSYDYVPVWRDCDIRPQTEFERKIERAYENEQRRINRQMRKKQIERAKKRIAEFFERIRKRAAETYGPNTVWFDTETTGLGYDAELVEITIRNLNGVLLDTLVKPANALAWPGAEAIHGITPDMVANAPSADSLADEIRRIMRGRIVAGYNVDFNLRILRQSGIELHCRSKADEELAQFWGEAKLTYADSVCLMNLFARYYGEYSDYHGSYTWKGLDVAAEVFDIEFEGEAHRSAADCLVSQRLHERLITAEDITDHAIYYLEGI